MTHDEKMQATRKALDHIIAGFPLNEPRDIFPRTEHWSAAAQLTNGRIESYLLPLLEHVTGCTRHTIEVLQDSLTFVCYWPDGDEAGRAEMPRTDRHFTDVGRAAMCAILMALRAELLVEKENEPALAGRAHDH